MSASVLSSVGLDARGLRRLGIRYDSTSGLVDTERAGHDRDDLRHGVVGRLDQGRAPAEAVDVDTYAPYGPPFNAALAPLIEEDASVLTFLDPLTTHP